MKTFRIFEKKALALLKFSTAVLIHSFIEGLLILTGVICGSLQPL